MKIISQQDSSPTIGVTFHHVLHKKKFYMRKSYWRGMDKIHWYKNFTAKCNYIDTDSKKFKKLERKFRKCLDQL